MTSSDTCVAGVTAWDGLALVMLALQVEPRRPSKPFITVEWWSAHDCFAPHSSVRNVERCPCVSGLPFGKPDSKIQDVRAASSVLETKDAVMLSVR